MNGNKMETPRRLSIVFGVIGVILLAILGLHEIWKVFRLRIGVPNLSNVSKIEIVIVTTLFLAIIFSAIFGALETDKSIDSSPPSESYLNTRSRVRYVLAVFILLIFVTQ